MIHPELGYFDEGLDLTEAAVYEPATGAFGRARMLNPVAYRSKIFADLEDEKVWTRSWLCVGSAGQIAAPGDLLPYTVGNHGIHVQRGPDGALVGRFNLAQHGGCRAIPAQCQTGLKTKCSFTSCGYSRDRDVIPADELGDNTPAMRQYLGYRPDRLFPIKVDRWGRLIFVNLDHEAPPLDAALGDLPGAFDALPEDDRSDVGAFWLESGANWKLFAAALMDEACVPADPAAEENGAYVLGAREAETVAWLFPNLLLARGADRLVSVVMQPTSITDTLVRVRVAAGAGSSRDAAALVDAWRAIVDAASERAVARQATLEAWGTPARPETAAEEPPIETSPTGYRFQRYLLSRLLAEHDYVWPAPLFNAATR